MDGGGFLLDVKISRGQIIDGTGGPVRVADIIIQGDTIVGVGDFHNYTASKTINAAGLCVCPGFIDTHSHTDDWYLINPYAVSKLLQGITTEIIGNCGESVVPVLETSSQLTPAAWHSLTEFINCIQAHGIAINTATLIGHGNLRAAIMGNDNRTATISEINDMQGLLRECLQAGALGLSTGLIYPPGCFADTNELIKICVSMVEYCGIYTTHLRDEGDAVETAVEEAITICQASGVRGVISHHKAVGKDNWGKVNKTLAALMQAQANGIDIYCDIYPYTALNTSLYTLLPAWMYAGGTEQMLTRLANRQASARLQQAIDHTAGNDYDRIIITKVNTAANKHIEGWSVSKIAAAHAEAPALTIIRLLLEEAGAVSMIRHAMAEADLKAVMKFPYSMIGTDAGARVSVGPLAEGLPHPRTYGTFPRVLGKFVRDEQLLPLPTAIYKMTALPAKVFGLTGRGQILPGYLADLTIFNFATVKDTATFNQPFLVPEGIKYVLVNGQVAVDQGVLTTALAGRFIPRAIC